VVLAAACGGPGPVIGRPSDAPVSSAPLEHAVVDREPLAEGTSYRAGDALQDIDVLFTAPSTPVYGLNSHRRVGVSADPAGLQPLVVVLPLANLRVFSSPDVTLEDVEDDLGELTTEAPTDVIAWLAERPYLTVGAIEDVEVGSLRGRGFEYTVGPLPDTSRACGGAAAQLCGATLWASGSTYHVSPGERGRVIQLDAAGQPLLVLISDGPVAAEVVPTLRFELAPPPASVGHTLRLPYFAPGLMPDQRYYVDKVMDDLGIVVTAPSDAVTASQRDEVLWFGDPDQPAAARHYDFVALDAGTAVVNGDPKLDPYALAGPGGIATWQLRRFLQSTLPLPDDPVGWLTEQPFVEVVEPEHAVALAGVEARVADVRVRPATAGISCPDGAGTCVMPFAHAADAFPMVISSEYVTRVVDFDLDGRRLLITADLATPGEPLLDSLCAFVVDPGSSEPVCSARRERS
jgi:hypothetical protein